MYKCVRYNLIFNILEREREIFIFLRSKTKLTYPPYCVTENIVIVNVFRQPLLASYAVEKGFCVFWQLYAYKTTLMDEKISFSQWNSWLLLAQLSAYSLPKCCVSSPLLARRSSGHIHLNAYRTARLTQSDLH